MEHELIGLRAAASEHRQHMKAKDKLVKEIHELKSIVSNQDDQVRIIFWRGRKKV